MSIKAKLQQAGDGTAIPANMVGEILSRTTTVSFSSQNGWRASSALTAIPAGTYIVFGTCYKGTGAVDSEFLQLATSGTNDSAGFATGFGGWIGGTGNTAQIPLLTPSVHFINTNGSTNYYAKFFSQSVITATATITFYFQRIA